MTVLYKVLDGISPPPQSIIDAVDCDRRPDKAEIGYYTERNLKNWHDYEFLVPRNRRVVLPGFEDWVKTNLTPYIVDCGVNYASYDEPTGRPTSTGAHTDALREYSLMWEIESGGPNAELYFWREKGYPLYRAPKCQGEDRTQLEFVDKFRYPFGQWTLIDTRVLHSVENLTSTRITLQVSLLNDLAVHTIQGIGDINFLKG